MNKEIWKPVIGFEGFYEISNFGRVKSTPRPRTHGGLIKIHVNKNNGYCYVNLSKNNKQYNKRVHVLVMEAFTDFRSNGFNPNAVIDHLDRDKTNNRLENLDICSQKENDRRWRAGVVYNGTPVINLSSKEVFVSYTDAARSVGGKQGEMVARVCRGERSHYRGQRFARLKDYENGTIPTYKGSYERKSCKKLWQ